MAPSLDIFSLAGRTALVAGASRGIGLAIARGLAAAGARTVLAARSLDRLQAEAARLTGEGRSAEARPLDVCDPESIRALAASLDAPDILVNVAGTNLRKPFVDYTPEEYRWLMDTNLNGLFALTQAVGSKMIARGRGGKVISIGSISTLLGYPWVSVYAMTKGALGQLTKVLATEWGAHGIQVNCIAPGFILTDLNRAMWQRPEMQEWLKGVQANPVTGTPEDVANLAVFLAGRGSDFITGQVIAVDGGFTTTSIWPYQPDWK